LFSLEPVVKTDAVNKLFRPQGNVIEPGNKIQPVAEQRLAMNRCISMGFGAIFQKVNTSSILTVNNRPMRFSLLFLKTLGSGGQLCLIRQDT